jgi:hypothetical protein
MFDAGPLLLLGLAAVTLPGSLIVGLLGYSRRERDRRALWLPGLHLLFLLLWGGFCYQTFFLNEPLIFACQSGNVDEVRNLLWRGADPNATWEDGRTALEFAQDGGHTEVVRALVEASYLSRFFVFVLVVGVTAACFCYWTLKRPRPASEPPTG